MLRIARTAALALLLVALGSFTPALACPFCNGGASGVNEVKEGIFNATFWPRVGAVLAPFPILGGIVALIYFGPTGRK